ncbi:hypothetical protein ACWD4O_41940 [Streptomyces sp. NPDC002623]
MTQDQVAEGGWDWIARLAAQDIQFARGTHTPALAINNKQHPGR